MQGFTFARIHLKNDLIENTQCFTVFCPNMNFDAVILNSFEVLNLSKNVYELLNSGSKRDIISDIFRTNRRISWFVMKSNIIMM